MIRAEKRVFKGIHYLVYYPKNFEKGKKYPAMFHLHGSGSRGHDFIEFKDSNIIKMIEEGNCPLNEGFCFIPQCSTDTWFDHFSELLELAKYLHDLPEVDQSKFNASGVSMGGYAIYQVMISLPELFNKAIVCCGGGMYWNVGSITNIKFRIFHGAHDTAVFPDESKRMYDRLVEANADVKLIIYPDRDHNAWDDTYGNMDNLRWLFE